MVSGFSSLGRFPVSIPWEIRVILQEVQRCSGTTGMTDILLTGKRHERGKESGDPRATEVKRKETSEEGRVGRITREVKWNDPQKCLVEFHEEVLEDF